MRGVGGGFGRSVDGAGLPIALKIQQFTLVGQNFIRQGLKPFDLIGFYRHD
jgi:hypothetical protein